MLNYKKKLISAQILINKFLFKFYDGGFIFGAKFLKYLVVPIVAIFLTDCSSEKLKGKRLDLFESERDQNVDENLKKIGVNFSKPINNDSWIGETYSNLHDAKNFMVSFNPTNIKKSELKNEGSGTSNKQKIACNMIFFDDSVYYVDSSGVLFSWNINTMKKNWSTKISTTEDVSPVSGIIFDSNYKNIYANTAEGKIIKISRKNGKILKKYETESSFRSAPIFFNNFLISQAANNKIFVLNSETMSCLWSSEENSDFNLFFGGASPVVKNNVLISSNSSGEVIAYDVTSGENLWKENLTEKKSKNSSFDILQIDKMPVIVGNSVILSTHNNMISSNKIYTGERNYSINLSAHTTPCVSNDWMFVIDNNFFLNSINVKTGKMKWRTQISLQKINYCLMPMILNGKISLITDSGKMNMFDPKSGEKLFELDLKISKPVSAIVAKNKIIVLDEKCKISLIY